MKRNSIRLRVLVLASASVVVTLGVAGASLVLLFERQVVQYVENDLDVHWTELATSFGLNENGEPEISRTLADPRYERPYGGAYWQVSDQGGAVLRSRSLWDYELAVLARGGEAAFQTQGPNRGWLYAIAREVTTGGGAGPRSFTLIVALDQEQLVRRRQAFSWDVTRVLVPIAAVLLLFAWFQIWLGLRELRVVDAHLNAVQSGEIPRLPGAVPEEVEPLVKSINRLLDRQETLIRKARDRAGALAHGLKTPLTVLGGEVRRLDERGLSDEARRMQEQLSAIRKHVDRELARARTSGTSVASGAYTAVDETVTRLLNLMQRMPRGEELIWETSIPPDLKVTMDADDFGEVLGNLLDNARKWAKTRVVVRAESAGELAIIRVEDDGPGFPAANCGAQPQRGLPSTADATSSGLGLGIVQDILAEHGTQAVIRHNGLCSVSFEVSLSR